MQAAAKQMCRRGGIRLQQEEKWSKDATLQQAKVLQNKVAPLLVVASSDHSH